VARSYRSNIQLESLSEQHYGERTGAFSSIDDSSGYPQAISA